MNRIQPKPAQPDTQQGGADLFRLPYRIAKRCFDLAVSLCASVILLIPMAVVALLIVCQDFGNPFYVQERIGFGGKPIRMVKFRSMRLGADRLEATLTPAQLAEYRKEYKLADDPRLIGCRQARDGASCFGALLRRTCLDELPQIVFNICLFGNMSLVGPRPILREEWETYYTPKEQQLFVSAKPGLTGYWQAYAQNTATYQNGRRQRMELAYCRNCSFAWDIRILLRTAFAVIRRAAEK